MTTMAAGLVLSGCASAVPPARGGIGRMPGAPAPVIPAPGTGGLLVGSSGAELARLLGQPTRQFREGDAVKLQYRGRDCVLDAYLYPDPRGGGPVVTHIDTRLPDGRDTERSGCVARLQQRPDPRAN